MLIGRNVTGKKGVLRACAISIVTFCCLVAGISIIVNKHQDASGDSPGVNFSVNDNTLGHLQYIGWPGDDRCSSVSDYSDSAGFGWTASWSDLYRIALPNNTLKACPIGDATFVGWYKSGSLVSTDPTISSYDISWMTNNDSDTWDITAVFASSSAGYTVTINPGSNGSVSSVASGQDYAVSTDNNIVTITVDTSGNVTTGNVALSPSNGYFANGFTSASNATSWARVSNNPTDYTLNLTGNDTLTPVFTPYTDVHYTIGVNDANAGTIDLSGGACGDNTNTNQTQNRTLVESGSNWQRAMDTNNNGQYDGTNVENDIRACPNPGYHFTGWTIDDEPIYAAGTNPVLDEVGYWPLETNNMNHALRAVFAADAYTVNFGVNDSSRGTITVNNTNSKITANPNNTATSSIAMNVNCNGNCNVTTDAIQVQPANGYVFTGWTYSQQGASSVNTQSGDSYTFNLTGADQITANFVPTYTVTAQSSNSSYGQIKFVESPASSTYTASAYGTDSSSISFDVVSENSVTTTGYLEVLPRAGYKFDGFTYSNGNVSTTATGNSNQYLLNFSGAGTITANFSPITYNVTFTTNDASKGQLKITNTMGSQTVNPDDTVASSITVTVDCSYGGTCSVRTNSLQPRPASGYAFDHFEYSTNNASYNSSTSDPENNKYQFNLNGADTVTAVFVSTIFVNYANGSINNQTINVVEPGTQNTKTREDAHPGMQTGITYNQYMVPVGAHFVKWVDENDVEKSTSATYIPTGNDLLNNPTYHPVFAEDTIYYQSGTANGVSIPAIDYNNQTKTSDSGFSVSGVRIDTSLIPAGWRFTGWANENGIIQSTNVNFTPSGSNQIYDGATYHPVFEESTMYAVIAVNNAALGRVGCNNNNQGACNSGNEYIDSFTVSYTAFHSGNNYFDIVGNSIDACPIGNAEFMYWKVAGSNDTHANNQINKWSDQWAWILDSDAEKTKTIIAYFRMYQVGVNLPEVGSIDTTDGTCANSTNADWTSPLVNVSGNTNKINGPNGAINSDLVACVDDDDYAFDHWHFSYTDFSENISSNPIFPNESTLWPTDPDLYELRAIFSPKINYLDGPIDGSTSNTVATVDPDTGNAKSYDLSTSVTGATFDANSLPNNVKFAGWEHVVNDCAPGTCELVSIDSTFVPTGSQIYAGATYRPLFVTDANRYTVVTADQASHGYISYYSNSQSAWIDLVNNNEYHVMADNNDYIAGGIKAKARDNWVFDHWELNGVTVTAHGDTIETGDIPYQAGQNGELPHLVAYYRPKELPFTGSFTIWLILGAGIGFVVVPSIVLLINERKEQSKGGKK